MKQRATAIAIAAIMVAAGLSTIAPQAAAQPTNCAATYAIADSETTATPRILLGGMEEIGEEEVVSGTEEELHVRLDSPNDKLEWEVFQLKADGSCDRYKAGSCDGELDSEGEEDSCVLAGPSSGVASYFLHVENSQDDRLTYTPWVVL